MIKVPGAGRTWDEMKADVPVGTRLDGTVKLIVYFGLWIDAGLGFTCLMLIPECGVDRGISLFDAFAVEQRIVGDVIWHNDRDQQINLSRRNITG